MKQNRRKTRVKPGFILVWIFGWVGGGGGSSCWDIFGETISICTSMQCDDHPHAGEMPKK